MDILIKSFNRPYYLERCLRSIQLQVQGNYHIKILDDGTPPAYLNRIQELFPEVEIRRSPGYNLKVAAIEADGAGGKKFDAFSIPSDFWIEEVRKATSLFFLFEDDFWMTRPVSLPEVAALMEQENLLMLKTYWGKNESLMRGPKRLLNAEVEAYQPKIPFHVDFLFHNHLKFRSILYHLNVFTVTNRFVISFYDLYSVASAFYQKDYWMYLWETAAKGKVNETLQLLQAAKWWKTKKGGYSRFKTDVSNTSYITSATNIYPDVNLNIFRFNKVLNEAWLAGTLDAMDNYPKDIRVETLEQVLSVANDPEASVTEWRKWIERFRGQYAGFGYEVM